MDKQPKPAALLATAAIVPGVMMASFYLKKTPAVIVGIVLAYAVAYCVYHYLKISNRFARTVLITLITSYGFSITRTTFELIANGEPAMSRLYDVFIASGVSAISSFGIILPAWIVLIISDYIISVADITIKP